MDRIQKGKYIIIGIIALIAINDIIGLSFLARIYTNLGDMKTALTMGFKNWQRSLFISCYYMLSIKANTGPKS